MANGTIINSGNHVIKPGLRADIMRNLMETKNTLSHAGSIYVGTGDYISMGRQGDSIEVYKTKELRVGASGQILSANADGNDLEYRYIGELNFGGPDRVKSFLGSYTALFKTEEIADQSDSLLIKIKSGVNEKKVYVEHAETADKADEALSASSANTATTANTASVAAQVEMNIDGSDNPTNVKFYTKTYSTLDAFKNDDQIKAAAAYGAITQALFGKKSGDNIIEYIPVMVIPGISADASSQNKARIFDASSETAQWRTLTLADFSGGNILKVVYVR